MTDVPQWWMTGDWFDVCSCNIACPCEFAQPPTNNKCQGVLAYHVREGVYGDSRLDDFSVIAVAEFEGNVWTGEASLSIGLFIDERADEAQRQALQSVFSGQAGGFMAGGSGPRPRMTQRCRGCCCGDRKSCEAGRYRPCSLMRQRTIRSCGGSRRS